MTVVVALAFAIILFIVGGWGRRNAESLAPSAMSTEGRRNSARMMTRGSVACEVFAWVFAGLGLLDLVSSVSGR
jgi:hypothetical protein